MSGWGTGPWGTGVWGIGSSSSLAIASALAVSEREIVVHLTTAPAHLSTIGVGDALNPKTWTVTNLDNSFVFVVLAVKQLTTTSYELYLLQKLASYLVTHRVSAPGLVTTSGALIGAPSFYDFFGCDAIQIASTKVGLVDLKNPMTDSTALSGTLVVGSDGDYDTESGVELLRKLIIRRLTTTPGEWFYFTGYGLGVRVQEPLQFSDLNQLRTQAERQVRMEPELSGAVVRVITDPKKGIVTFFVDAKLRRSNRQVTIPIQAPVTSNVIL